MVPATTSLRFTGEPHWPRAVGRNQGTLASISGVEAAAKSLYFNEDQRCVFESGTRNPLRQNVSLRRTLPHRPSLARVGKKLFSDVSGMALLSHIPYHWPMPNHFMQKTADARQSEED
jgi:hypothetical protein